MVQIESGHAAYFAKQLQAAGIELPKTVPLLEMAGRLLGEAVELTGPEQTCKLGIALESRAIEVYRRFALRSGTTGDALTCWNICWMKNSACG